ncbi:MAG: hypothetical protein JKY70_21700 [Mucilaginibacter sp.]|nr:hypothetical protein [Mucilaginibacter sp.]
MANFKNTRFTLMAFPQSIDADGNLSLNFLFIPRNINPIKPVNTIFSAAGTATAFADAKPVFNAVICNNPDEFAGKLPDQEHAEALSVTFSTQAKAIYQTLKDAKDTAGKPKYFNVDDNLSNDNPAQSPEHRAPVAEDASSSVKKYLPKSYQAAFNFNSPRVRNAVTDDSYHCAMRDNVPPANVPVTDTISWGKVYAHLLRQPLMAGKAGLLYKTTVKLKDGDFKKAVGYTSISLTAQLILPSKINH